MNEFEAYCEWTIMNITWKKIEIDENKSDFYFELLIFGVN